MAQIIFQNPNILLLLPLVWLLLVVFAWRRRFKPFGPFLLRLLVVVLIVLALAQPTITPPAQTETGAPQERLVVLVDQSASLGQTGQQALRAEAARLTQGDPNAVVLFFADRAIWVNNPAPAGVNESTAAPDEPLNPESTNLAEALLLAGELLAPSQQPGRVVLLSDGAPTAGDTLNAADRLARQNIPVDVLLVDEATQRAWHNGQNDARLVSLSLPQTLRQGEPFNVEVIIHSQTAIPDATLTLTHPAGQDILAEDVIALEPGLNRFTFSDTVDEIGSHTYQAAITTANDYLAVNNSLAAFAQVYPAPHILIIAEDGAAAGGFAAQMQTAGYETTIARPQELSDRLSALEPYAGMVLLDVSARSFNLEQMIAIQEYTRSLGRGLVATAGRNSFGLGKYEDTPLAELLPVTMEPPPREERPPVALLLVIDHSGSMVEDRGDLPTALTMAKEAAIRATDILGPQDIIGIMMFDNKYEWVVPFQQVSDGAELLQIQQRVARIPGGGGTRILQTLEVALPALMEQEIAVARHAILLSDGKSFDGDRTLEDYERIVDAAVEANITLSTIAITNEADTELLSYLAERGRGRYHFANTPEELPALTISESDILRSQTLQEGDFAPAIYAPHPIVRGLFSPLPTPDKPAPPSLSGYLAMTPKPEAEVALQVGPGDPLLTVWGYGLGRTAVWSSDTGAEWATAWRDWPDFNKFLSQVVAYTLPAPDLGLLQLEATLEPDGQTVALSADGVNSTGFPVELARTEAALTTPGGGQNQLRLQQVGPGRYERRVRLPNPGVYQFTVTQTRADEPQETATIGFVLPYPAEYGLPPEGAGRPLLEQIAATTGGSAFAPGQFLNPNLSAASNQDGPLAQAVELWPWLLLVALILWPVEIAWRRWGRLRIQ